MCGVQKYRLYLKRVSGVSPTQGRRGLGTQSDWPPMMGPNPGMGMSPAQSPMGPMPPVRVALTLLRCSVHLQCNTLIYMRQ